MSDTAEPRSPGEPDREERKKRVEQLKAKMEGLKRGISLGEKESTPPEPQTQQGGSEIIAINRSAEDETEGVEETNASNQPEPEIETRSRSAKVPSIIPRRTPSADPPLLQSPRRERDERRESYSLEPTQDLLCRLIEIQALLSSYAVEIEVEGQESEDENKDTSNPDNQRMMSIWKPKFDEVMELVASSIEFFRDHEIVPLKEPGAEDEEPATTEQTQPQQHQPEQPKKPDTNNDKDKGKEQKSRTPLTRGKTQKFDRIKSTRKEKDQPEIAIKRTDEAPKARPVNPVSKYNRASVVLDQRSRIEIEIFESEATFVGQLKILIENYFIPLRDGKVESVEKLNLIFSNVEILYQYNTRLLELLEKVIIERDNMNSIGKIFLEMAPFLKLYKEYVTGVEKATQVFNQCMKGSSFSSAVNDLASKLNNKSDQVATGIPDLLITPVQRIPRYVLLLQELLKYTPSEHGDYNNINQAIAKIKEIADELNNSQRQHDTLKKVVEIQASIDGDFLNLVEPHRLFAKEGLLMAMWVKPEGGEAVAEGYGSGATGTEFMFFLFNDLILYALQKKKFGMRGGKVLYDYKGFFLLFNANVVDVPDGGSNLNTIELIYKEDPAISPSASQRYLLRAHSAEEKKEWLQNINTQIAAARSTTQGASKIDLFKPTTKQGYLFKRGENRKNWKRRYFRMKGNSLFYYENAKETTPIGAVFLPDYSLHMAEERMKKLFCFELRHPEKRCYFFQADCGEVVAEWTNALYRPIAWIDSDIANRYLDKDVVNSNREEKIMASDTSERVGRRAPAFAAFRNAADGRKITSFRTPGELQKERAGSVAPAYIETRPSKELTANKEPATVTGPTQPTLRPGMRLGLIGRERGAAAQEKEKQTGGGT